MRLPKTSCKRGHGIREIVLGMGDYVAGGADTVPFLDLDGARRRRPLIFGEVTDDLSGYPRMAAGMFSGRQEDPVEWAVMWKEIGADGICLRIGRRECAADLVRTVAERTCLPVVVFADDEGCFEDIASADIGSKLILVIGDGDVRTRVIGSGCGHAIAVCGRDSESLKTSCRALLDQGFDEIILNFCADSVWSDLGSYVSELESIRKSALEGDDTLSYPVMCDVTSSWDVLSCTSEDNCLDVVRRVSMQEAIGALSAMMSGADIIIVRGPGAADMARVYGEELADL